mmetsp:Transcript_36265/g.91306  ORF Transcript_36265/g.91306 Transcript_36265/m.91306 type:complete len:413 (+) Transcript_36265:130-1368(+)
MARPNSRHGHLVTRSSSSPPNLVAQRRAVAAGLTQPDQQQPQQPADEGETHRVLRSRTAAGGCGAESKSPLMRHKIVNDGFGVVAEARKELLQVGNGEIVEPSIDAVGDDFVEGGIELSPPKGADACLAEPDDLPARCLLQMEEEELRELWPPGDGPKALFLDYDGTLREFEARPEMATPTPEIIDLLTRMNAREDFTPHIISGRDAAFLEAHFGRFDRFTLIAEHGFQISQPGSERHWELWEQYGGNVRTFKDHENWKVIMRAEIERLVRASPGSHLEEKQSALVWHYREVASEAQAEAAAVNAVSDLECLREKEKIKDVKISHGHKVVEVSYRNVRKGLVMRRLCEEKALFGEPFTGVLAAGDDVSDETMFDAAPRDFLTIKVGQASTLARFRVDSPQQLRQFLHEKILS